MIRAICIALLTILTVISCDLVKRDDTLVNFVKYVRIYNKTYKNYNEFQARYNIFKENVGKMNRRMENNSNFELDINEFSDMTSNEFSNNFLNLQYNLTDLLDAQVKTAESFVKNTTEGSEIGDEDEDNVFLKANTVPASYDWRSYGAVTAVKNQGSCGGCWAFSTVANIESQYFLKYKKLYSFSEQHLLNCNLAQAGCGGGFMTGAIDYIKSTNGLPLTASVPYVASRQSCNGNVQGVARVSGYKTAGSTNEDSIRNFLYTNGPISGAMNANSYLQSYKSGVLYLTSSQCSPNGINHAITIVGYGTANGIGYWIVKNSWGSSWGEQGYFRIARGYGTCGINAYAISAIVA